MRRMANSHARWISLHNTSWRTRFDRDFMPHFPILVPGEKQLAQIQPKLNPIVVADPLTAMVLRPRSCWQKFRADKRKFHQVFEEQVFFLAALPSVFGGIGFTVFGTLDWETGLKRALIGYVASILFIYAAALFAHKTAEMFAGRDNIDTSGKLVIYSLMPFYVASVFLIHPTLAPLSFFGAFGAYHFFQGAGEMTDVPPGKVSLYGCVNIVAWVFVLDRLMVTLFG